MKIFFPIVALVVLALCLFSTPTSYAAPAGCSGATVAASWSGSFATPLRSALFSRQPLRNVVARVQSRRATRIAAKASCSGSLATQACGGSSVASCSGL